MADYFTDFSCMFDTGTPDNARRALELYRSFSEQLEREEAACPGFAVAIEPEDGGTALRIHSGECGEPEHVTAFVLLCAQTFQLKGRWGFEWAHTCSKPRLEAFGGGALIVDLADGSIVASVSTNDWLTRNLSADGPCALTRLIDTVEATGGLVRLEDGRLYPAADEDWADIADAYLAACAETGRAPLIGPPADSSAA